MRPFRCVLSIVALSIAACERSKAPARTDSLPSARGGASDTAAAALSPRGRWDDAAGPVLLVAASSPASAFVVTPDSATAAAQLASIPRPASVTLFGRGGTVQLAELSSVSNAGVCAIGPLSA